MSILRKAAAAKHRGEKYFTHWCQNCQKDSLRWSSTASCIECTNKWKKANKHKVYVWVRTWQNNHPQNMIDIHNRYVACDNNKARQDARKLGFTTYQATKPCRHGHLSKRYTASNRCLECCKNLHLAKNR